VNVTAGGRRALSGLRNGETDETVRGTDSCGSDDGDAGRRLAGGRAGANPEMPGHPPEHQRAGVGHPGARHLLQAVRPLVRASMWPCANSGCRLAGGWRCTLAFNVPPPAAVFTRCTRAYLRQQFTFLYGGGAGEE
jgi:hypothetical protein